MPRRTLPRNGNRGRPKSVNGISTHTEHQTHPPVRRRIHTHTPKPIHIWHGSRVATRNFYVLRIKRNDLKLKRLRPHGFRTVRNSLSIDRQRTVNGFIGTRWQFNMSLCRWKQKRKSKSEKNTKGGCIPFCIKYYEMMAVALVGNTIFSDLDATALTRQTCIGPWFFNVCTFLTFTYFFSPVRHFDVDERRTENRGKVSRTSRA